MPLTDMAIRSAKPSEEVRASLEAATTFKAVADELITKADKEGKTPATLRAPRRHLALLARLQSSPVADMEPVERLPPTQRRVAPGPQAQHSAEESKPDDHLRP